MKQLFFDFYGYVVFAYSSCLVLAYILLMWGAYVSLRRRWQSMRNLPYRRRLIRNSPFTPGVSIVAPAYNEEATIITNITTLLDQDYPLFEVVIVNDGSKDRTLELMKTHFDLVQVPYAYVERIAAKPFKGLYRSTNPKYRRLTVVDKENGGTKADAVNAGLNVASFPYFINTDVDCVLSREAIYNCILPVVDHNDVIAVSGVMAISNGCRMEKGRITHRRAPFSLIPLFQTGEYMRSFLLGKMGWSAINGMNNVSGGYGLFDREVVMNAGGYGSTSFAEDMDMLIRMVAYCCDVGRPYRVVQIADTCCWTEGPPNLRTLARQRIRWGRGLIQTFATHRRILFKKRYRQLGMLTLPYTLIFEFLAPVIEMGGLLAFLWLVFTNGVNYETALVIFAFIFTFGLLLGAVVILYDYLIGSSYTDRWSYLRQFAASVVEPFLFHPLITFFSLKGYWNYFTGKKAVWGKMERKGMEGQTPEQQQQQQQQQQKGAEAPSDTATPGNSATPGDAANQPSSDNETA